MDEENTIVCGFCQESKADLGMQVLPNGQPMLLCGSCAAAMQVAAETAQKQFDTINKAVIQNELQTRVLLILGTLGLSVGISGGWFKSSVWVSLAIFGGCFFLWGLGQRLWIHGG